MARLWLYASAHGGPAPGSALRDADGGEVARNHGDRAPDHRHRDRRERDRLRVRQRAAAPAGAWRDRSGIACVRLYQRLQQRTVRQLFVPRLSLAQVGSHGVHPDRGAARRFVGRRAGGGKSRTCSGGIGHGRLFSAAGSPASDGPPPDAGRRRGQRATGGGRQPQLLASYPRRRSDDCRHPAHEQRPHLHRSRRATGGIRRARPRSADRCLDATRRARNDGGRARRPLTRGRRPAPRRPIARRGTDAGVGPRRTPRTRLSRDEPRNACGAERTSADDRPATFSSAARFQTDGCRRERRPDGRGRPRARDRLCQRSRPPGLARHRTRPRNGRAAGAWRGQNPGRANAAHRKPRPRHRRRHLRSAAGALDLGRAAVVLPRRTGGTARHLRRRAHGRLHRGDLDRQQPLVRTGAGAPRLGCHRISRAARRRRSRIRRPRWRQASPSPRGRPSCRRRRSPCLVRTARQEPHERARRRPRIRHARGRYRHGGANDARRNRGRALLLDRARAGTDHARRARRGLCAHLAAQPRGPAPVSHRRLRRQAGRRHGARHKRRLRRVLRDHADPGAHRADIRLWRSDGRRAGRHRQ